MNRLSPARLTLTAALTAVVLSGCAAEQDAADDADATPSATSAASAASGVSEDGETRTVRHEKGETDVPADPQRVVVLDSPLLDAMLALGVTPVGAVRAAEHDGLPDYLGDRADEVEIVGTIGAPNLEAIAALKPDLILSSALRDEAIYDQLDGIAPTVFTKGPGNTWREDFMLAADAIGRSDQASEKMEEFEAEADELGEALDVDGDDTASIVRFLADETRVYGPESFSGSVLSSVGFGGAELEYDENAIANLSPEQIEQADADLMFATTYGAPEDSTRAAVTALWGNLGAVRENCQFDVDDDQWMVGIGVIGAQAILDDVERLAEDSCL